MKTIKFFILSALALGAIACTQERVENNDSGLVAAKVTAGMFTKADGAYWTGDQIGVFAVSPDDMAAEYQNVGYVTESTSTTATFTALAGEIYLTADETTFSAYAPYQSSLADGVISGNTADQSDPTALDYLFAEGATASMASPVVNFTFSHQMSQLIVNFVSTNEDAVDLVKAGAYTIGGLTLEGAFNVLTGETEVSGSAAEMAISDNCLSADVTGDYEGIAYQMILFPQTAEVYFAGTVNGEEFTTTAVSQTLVAGYSYNCTIELTIDEVTGEVTATVEGSTINDWEYGDWNSGEDEPGEEEPTSIDLSSPSTDATVETDGYTYDGTTLTVGVNTVITGGTSSDPYKGKIVIGADVTAVTFSNLYIDTALSSAAERIVNISSDLTLTLEGDNYIYLNDNVNTQYECVYVTGEGVTLTIEGDGSLTINDDPSVENHNNHAALCLDKANLIINSGTVTAKSGYNYAGIGSGSGGTCGNITINGGTVVGENYGGLGCGIGTGLNGTCGNITITGGNVTADCTKGNGAGMGVTSNGTSGTCGNIVITGGTVEATAQGASAAIGVGGNGNTVSASCGKIVIGENVTSVTTTDGNSATSSIGIGGTSNTCTGVFLGATSADDESVTSWTPTTGQLVLNPAAAGGTALGVYGWTEEDGTWTKEMN